MRFVKSERVSPESCKSFSYKDAPKDEQEKSWGGREREKRPREEERERERRKKSGKLTVRWVRQFV